MVKITFVQPDGSSVEKQAASGQSIMQVAVQEGVLGIEALCGGSMSCATCHVYVAPEDLARLPAMEAVEDDTLFGVVAERRPNSRLSCQLRLDETMDGVIVHIPDRQS